MPLEKPHGIGNQVVRKVLNSLQALAGRADAMKESAPFAGTHRKWFAALFRGFSLQNAVCPLLSFCLNCFAHANPPILQGLGQQCRGSQKP